MPNQNQPAAHIAHDAEPVADQRAGDDDQGHPEQHVDEKPLAARLAPAGDRRSEEQAGADPADADPDDRRLDVHVAEEVEWQELVQVEPVEAAPIVIGMRHDRAGEDLQEQHRRDHEEIFADLALALGQRPERDQHRVHRRLVGIAEPELVDKQHDAESKEGEAEADPGPHEGIGGRRVADFRLIRPVLGPRPARVGSAGDGGQRGVNQELGGMQRLGLVEAVGRGPAGGEIDRAQILRHLGPQRRDGARQGVGNGDLPPREVDPLQLLLHVVAHRGLLLRRQGVETNSEAGLGKLFFGQRGQAHQCEGGVVLAEIGAHAIEAPVIHQVGFLKTGLAGDDVVAGHQRRAAGGDEAVRLRRRPFVGQHRRPGEQRETADGHGEQDPFEDVADRVFQRAAEPAVYVVIGFPSRAATRR